MAANTKTSRTLMGGANDKDVVILFNLTSVDGTEESNAIVFDNSAFCNDVSRGKLMAITACGSDCLVTLAWDQATDSPVLSLNPVYSKKLCFEDFGGISNPGATGATGDLLLSTAGLDTGDSFTLILEIKQ